MRALVFALAATSVIAMTSALAPTAAVAQAMPNSLNMSCAATFDMVRQRGAVVIATGPNIFGRYVSDQRYCSLGETTFPAWLQTADQSQCFIGYRCREPVNQNR